MVNGVKVVSAILVGLAEMGALVISGLVINSIHKWHHCSHVAPLLAIAIIGGIVSATSGAILVFGGLYSIVCCCRDKFIKKPWFLFIRPLVLYAISAALYGIGRFVVKAPKDCHVKELHLFFLIGLCLFAGISILSLLCFFFTCREHDDDEEDVIERAPLSGTKKYSTRP